jgi:flagellin-like hook-associated protein FlgL
MPSQTVETLSAEDRFRQAFERLKAGEPKLLKLGTPVTQNNVAREAGCDPSALKKARFPALIRQIQAYIELHQEEHHSTGKKAKRQAANRSMQERLDDAIRQRDQAQSILVSAHTRIIELSEEVQLLQQQLDEARPTPMRHNPS